MYVACAVCRKQFVAHWPELWPFRDKGGYYCSQACKDSNDERFKKKMMTDMSMKKGRPKGMGRCKITLEDKKKAVQIAIDGGDPLEFLKRLRSKNPSALWWSIKENLKTADPAMYALLPAAKKDEPAEIIGDEDDPLIQKLVAPVTGPVIIEPVMKAETEGPGEDEKYWEKKAEEAGVTVEAAKELGQIRMKADKETEKEAKPKICRPIIFDGLEVCGLKGECGVYQVKKQGDRLIIGFIHHRTGSIIDMPEENWKRFIRELFKAAAVLGADIRPEEAP